MRVFLVFRVFVSQCLWFALGKPLCSLYVNRVRTDVYGILVNC